VDITVRATDPGGLFVEDTFRVTVTAVNDAPVNTAPGPQTTSLNTPLTFSPGTGNALAVADVDAGSLPMLFSLSVTRGTLTLSTTAGLTFLGGGNGTGGMIVTGSQAAMNAALNGLIYTPPTGFTGTAVLFFKTSDLGNTGLGGPRFAGSMVLITVAPPAAGLVLLGRAGEAPGAVDSSSARESDERPVAVAWLDLALAEESAAASDREAEPLRSPASKRVPRWQDELDLFFALLGRE
jgi:hypothetical protein